MPRSRAESRRGESDVRQSKDERDRQQTHWFHQVELGILLLSIACEFRAKYDEMSAYMDRAEQTFEDTIDFPIVHGVFRLRAVWILFFREYFTRHKFWKSSVSHY